jgi:hypothetical protein
MISSILLTVEKAPFSDLIILGLRKIKLRLFLSLTFMEIIAMDSWGFLPL